MAQHTQLLLALLEGLCSHSRPQCDLAAQLLLTIFEDRSIKAEQVRPGPVQESGEAASGPRPPGVRMCLAAHRSQHRAPDIALRPGGSGS